MLMRANCRHRSLPSVLSNAPIVRVFAKRGFLDTVAGGFHDVCWSMFNTCLRLIL